MEPTTGDASYPVVRIARATSDLEAVQSFYCDVLGLCRLGSFADHEGFDGVMFGFRGAPYHFEFTVKRGREAEADSDPDDLIVLYLPDPAAWNAVVDRARRHGHAPVASNNPYWDRDGITLVDPDGRRVVLQCQRWR